MRRKDFMSKDYDELEAIAKHCEVGYLGIHDPDGYPRIVPLNFLLIDRCIYFHGAQEGEKLNVLSTNPKVTFSLVEPHSLIPSYWIAKDYACPATALYKSIYFRGQGNLVHDLGEKAMALQSFMEKYQPEGNYQPIIATDPMYTKQLQRVSVFKIVPTQIDMKFKFGQNFSVKKRRELIEKLQERNRGVDMQTAEEIKRTLKGAGEGKHDDV